MNALSSAAAAGGGGHGALHLLAKGCSNIAVSEFLAPSAGSNKRKRRPAGTPDPGAEVVALSPKTLMESDRYVCEICNQGFQRDQNLQMHRRRHKVPWKLLKKPSSSLGTNKRVYICPERSCLHHDPTHALGDLVGIKKHYRRKHCTDKQWKCVKCSKRYAVQSDYKAHLKTCGTRGHCCDCGRVFSRVESFIEHQDTCSAAKRNTTQHSSLLHHNTDGFTSNASPSHSSDTTQAISFAVQSGLMSDTSDFISTKINMDERPRRTCQVNQEVHRSAAILPSWLITERRNELELLPSMQWEPVLSEPPHSIEFSSHASHGSSRSSESIVNGCSSISATVVSCPDSKKDLIQLLAKYTQCGEDMHTPCLRLSIGPAAFNTDEMASLCTSPHPSLDHSKPRFSSVGKETLALSSHQRQASTGVFSSSVKSSHPEAIGKDLALSIPDQTMEVGSGTDHAGWTSDFLAQAAWLNAAQVEGKSAGLFHESIQSMQKNQQNNGTTSEIMASYNPCYETTKSSSDHEAGAGHFHESGVDRL